MVAGSYYFDLSRNCIFEMRPGHGDFLVSCVPLWTQQAGLSHRICVLTQPAVFLKWDLGMRAFWLVVFHCRHNRLNCHTGYISCPTCCIFEMRPGQGDFLVSCVPLWTQQAGLSHKICILAQTWIFGRHTFPEEIQALCVRPGLHLRIGVCTEDWGMHRSLGLGR